MASIVVKNNGEIGSASKPTYEMQEVKLNPLAEEFFPSPHPFNRRGNSYSEANFNIRGDRARRADSIRRTVYISDVDFNVSEKQLALLFIEKCGYVVDCRICGVPPVRYAFVEFTNERAAKEALRLHGTMVGSYKIKVSPSKSAILPVNPAFLPRSEEEKAIVDRTIFCANINKTITDVEVKHFFEYFCGEVTQVRLLGDNMHSTCIAFVEFASAKGAMSALNCSGMLLRNLPIRVSRSKTPVMSHAPSPNKAK